MKKDAAAIIVAAGQGLRFGGTQRKQYVLLGGRSLLEWAIRAFNASPSFGVIVVVAPSKDVDAVRRRVGRMTGRAIVTVVAGGATRAESVRRGLDAVPSGFSWIAVHDGVRPLVTPHLIERTLKEARRHGAAIAACPSKDTVKLARSNRNIHSTPPRDSTWLAQTPQIFRRSLLERAHRKGARYPVTDDAQLVERLGAPVRLVESSSENLKVTVPMDLEMARIILKSR